jgi:hypothetical protein
MDSVAEAMTSRHVVKERFGRAKTASAARSHVSYDSMSQRTSGRNSGGNASQALRPSTGAGIRSGGCASTIDGDPLVNNKCRGRAEMRGEISVPAGQPGSSVGNAVRAAALPGRHRDE